LCLARALSGHAKHLNPVCMLLQAVLSDAKLRDESRAGIALALAKVATALGSVKESAKETASATSLKQIVSHLAELATDTSPVVCEWATHGLGCLAEHMGNSFRAHLGTCLGVASSLLLSDPPPNVHIAHAIARLSASLLSALLATPELHSISTAGGKPAAQMAKMVRRFGVLNSAACSIVPQQSFDAEMLHFMRISLDVPFSLLPFCSADMRARLLPEQVRKRGDCAATSY
jgi:hypothetical protein